VVFAVKGLELYTAVRRYGRWPWQVKGQGTNTKEPGMPVVRIERIACLFGLYAPAHFRDCFIRTVIASARLVVPTSASVIAWPSAPKRC
jgi:hypothetical protein